MLPSTLFALFHGVSSTRVIFPRYPIYLPNLARLLTLFRLSILLLRRLKLDPLPVEQRRAADQRPDGVADVRAGDDGDGEGLPGAVPTTQLASKFINQYSSGRDKTREGETTYQSNGIGIAPNHAPTPHPSAPPHTGSAGRLTAQISRQT